MSKKVIKRFIIGRETCFQGERCVGLDSGFIISLIYYEEAFQEYEEILNTSLFNFTHEECVGGGKEIDIENSEVFKKLIGKYNMSKEEAITKINNFLEKYKINVIPKRTATKEYLIHLYQEAKTKGVESHPPDIWIVADFKACGVNLVYSNNKHFRALCELAGMSAPYFPTENYQAIDKPYFELFRKRRFRKKH